jgi:uncharacterized membrane protein YfcA
MSAQTIIVLILVGVVAGMLSGLVGVGGGIVIVPALVYILGFTQKQAQGTSLGLLMLPVGIIGVIQYYKNGFINVNYVIIIAVSFVIGSYMGSKLATMHLSDEKLKKIFAIILMLVSIKMLFFDRKKPGLDGKEKANIEEVRPSNFT